MAFFMSPVQADSFLGDVARIAAPIEFTVELTDVSTLTFSCNDSPLNGVPVDRFHIQESGLRIAIVTDNSWVLHDISRDVMYDFSLSAVTDSGQETRRGNRVYIDLPPLPGDTEPFEYDLWIESTRVASTGSPSSAEILWDSPQIALTASRL